jgi:SAM-dependent methyltransferase
MNAASSAESRTVGETPEAPPRSRGRVLKRWKSSFFQAGMRAHLRRALWFHRLARRLYEPVKINGRIYVGQRSSDDRWEAIAAELKANAAKNVLDIGCAEGWFVRRAATELGCYAVGVEASERLLGGEIARLHDKVENTAIMLSRASGDSLRKLPRFDVVICLSVVHHVIRRHGIGAARDFVQALASRAEKAVIFEMGTSDEADLKWRGLLEDMPSGQEAYVTQFLQTCGLRDVRLIASSPAFHGNASRLMFSCTPAPSS